MKKILFLCFLAICALYEAQAQKQNNFLRGISKAISSNEFLEKENTQQKYHKDTSLEDFDSNSKNTVRRAPVFDKTNAFNKIGNVKRTNDYVLYRDVVRKYTWLEGVGEPITQDVANHLPYYFRLSMKNKAGHYQVVEALYGDTLIVDHPLSTYILDKYNDVSAKNQEWRRRLLTIGQWLFYADISGENVVEERAYEAKFDNAQLVYAMQVVRNDSTHVTLTYLDSWGLPADMNENDSYTYGSVVYVTYSNTGCDSIIDYLDGKGYRKINTNGVDQQRYIYDEKHRITQVTSNNCVGDYTINNWGNCGVQYIYDDINNMYSIIHIDEYLKPMRMPSKRAADESTFIRCDVSRDKWGRISQKVFLTENGEKDATLSGIHRIVYSYSESDGRLIQKKYYDIHGNNILK